jgi:hypothetical protein
MKKFLAMTLSIAMTMTLLVGCSSGGAAVKTGLAVVSSLSKSANATAEAEGVAQTDSLIAAVLVDKNGKIVDCKIDAAQTKINFSTEGKLTTDVASTFKTKNELGTEYGMASASGIGKEWNEQAAAFAKYCVGKTVDEVKGIAVNEEGKAGDADLAASVTVHIGDFIEAVAQAAGSATDKGAKEGDKLGLAVTTEISSSTDATADAEGLAQSYSNIAVVTLDKNSKITSCIIDAIQGNVNFSTTGEITTDLTVAPQSKQVLKDAYGMKKASGIGKEWYEQADAFAKYCVGKTAADVKGIALTDDGHAADADLAASVTVHIGPFMTNVDKAAAAAK